MANVHKGSSLDDFLAEENFLAKTEAIALKEVIAWQLTNEMKEKHISKRALAALMKTSRTQIDRVLDPKNGNVTIETLQRAAEVMGKRIQLALI